MTSPFYSKLFYKLKPLAKNYVRLSDMLPILLLLRTICTFTLFTPANTNANAKPLSTMNDCSAAIHTGHITSMTMTPPAPIAGSTVIIHIDYTLDSPITDGLATYTATFNGFPLAPTTEPLCPDFKSTPCPLAPGEIHYEGTAQLGDGNIHGTLKTTTTWKDQNGNEVLCWGFTVRI